jgi:hypothetical protein
MLIGPLAGAGNRVTGVSADAELGSVFVSGSGFVLPTGVQGSSAINAVTVTATIGPAAFPPGVQGEAQLGLVTATTAVELNVTGVNASTAVGTLQVTPSIDAPVTGVQATAQLGTTTFTGNVSVQLTGVSATMNIGVAQAVIESEPFPLPADAVLVWDKTSSGDTVPTGFTEIDMGSKDYLIMGSTIADAGTFTSTVGTLSGSQASPSVGAHSTPWVSGGLISAGGGSGLAPVRYASSAGSHNHTVSISPTNNAIPTDTLPSGMGIKLITNAAEVSEVPENAVLFCDEIKSGFARKTWSGPTYGAYVALNNTATTVAAKSATAAPFSLTSTSNGSHQHTGPGTSASSGPLTSTVPNIAAGSHSHPLSTPSLNLYVYQYFKHLLPFIATTSSAVRSGMIVMFKGASVPSGWSLCDGTKGTPNMTSYFIGYNDNETSTDIVVGSRGAKATATAPPTTGSTSSTYTPTGIPVTLNTVTWPHSHKGGGFNNVRNPTNSHFHDTKSVPHSHTVPSFPLTVPTSFLPNTFRLAFIRKD